MYLYFFQPLPQDKVKMAQTSMLQFLSKYKQVFGDKKMTYKLHSASHIFDDVKRFQCHLEYISSYKFENFHCKWKPYIRSGNKAVEQVRYAVLVLHDVVLIISYCDIFVMFHFIYFFCNSFHLIKIN